MAGTRDSNLCPCGEGSLGAGSGLHVVCSVCRERVLAHVRRRFGPHRYSGRYAAEVEDIVQDCFRILLLPSGLRSFKPDPERKRSDAFRAWLWRVVHRHCNNKVQHFKTDPCIGTDPFDDLLKSRAPITPKQAFARRRIRELNERAVAEVERCWRAKGPKRGERFDVVLPLVYEMEADAKHAREQLGITDVHLNLLKWRLTRDIRRDVRKQILEDDVVLEPDSTPAAIERAIDQEIEALFQDAYPGSDPRFVFSKDPEPEPGPKPEHQDEQPEVRV